jgi:transaldolase
MHAFVDHGTISATIEKDLAKAQQQWAMLHSCGVDTDSVAQKLEEEGLKAFVQSFEELMESLHQKSHENS